MTTRHTKAPSVQHAAAYPIPSPTHNDAVLQLCHMRCVRQRTGMSARRMWRTFSLSARHSAKARESMSMPPAMLSLLSSVLPR